MSSLRKLPALLVILLTAGAVRIPMERGLSKELHAQRLLGAPLSVGARDKIGQTSYAVALGGLRTLVATFINLRAYTAFTELRWADLADNYDTAVDLAPHTGYYWESGSWHLAYNAATASQLDESLSKLRRRELWRAYIHQGRAFLERGIRNNPDNWSMNRDLGMLLANPYKAEAFPNRAEAFAAAADAYGRAAEHGAPSYVARNRFYAVTRVPGREAQALAQGEQLYAEDRKNRTPTLRGLLFVLRMHADPSRDPNALLSEVFTSDKNAYFALSALWLDSKDGYPVDGIAAVLPGLESRLAIPWEKSALNPRNRR